MTVGVGTVMDAREVMILITGAHKAFALYKVFTFNVRILVKFLNPQFENVILTKSI